MGESAFLSSRLFRGRRGLYRFWNCGTRLLTRGSVRQLDLVGPAGVAFSSCLLHIAHAARGSRVRERQQLLRLFCVGIARKVLQSQIRTVRNGRHRSAIGPDFRVIRQHPVISRFARGDVLFRGDRDSIFRRRVRNSFRDDSMCNRSRRASDCVIHFSFRLCGLDSSVTIARRCNLRLLYNSRCHDN